VREGKNRLNGFFRARSWFTALKRGVNEMISTEQQFNYSTIQPLQKLCNIFQLLLLMWEWKR
jgi:hypothetical protein